MQRNPSIDDALGFTAFIPAYGSTVSERRVGKGLPTYFPSDVGRQSLAAGPADWDGSDDGSDVGWDGVQRNPSIDDALGFTAFIPAYGSTRLPWPGERVALAGVGAHIAPGSAARLPGYDLYADGSSDVGRQSLAAEPAVRVP